MSNPAYRVFLRFFPNQANPKRPNGRGNYRVVGVTKAAGREGVNVLHTGAPEKRVMCLSTSRQVKVGSRVDPLKLALA